jgi:hypothetical protein
VEPKPALSYDKQFGLACVSFRLLGANTLPAAEQQLSTAARRLVEGSRSSEVLGAALDALVHCGLQLD